MGRGVTPEPPGGSTPIDEGEREGLRLPVATQGDLNGVEAENVLAAYGRHLGRRKAEDAEWLDEPFLRRVHRDMLGGVWTWAGKYRTSEKTIGVAPERIAESIGQLIGNLRYRQVHPEAMPLLERATRLHHELVRIHPFNNGNGRHARLITDIYLHSQRHALPAWPSGLNAEGAPRAAYLAALREADRGDIRPLVAFMKDLLPA